MVLPLSNIKPGTSAKIICLANDGLMAGRLFDLGFEPDAVVSCVLQKRKKNIAAYLVRNAVIALREEDSRLIMAKELPAYSPYSQSENAEDDRHEDPCCDLSGICGEVFL